MGSEGLVDRGRRGGVQLCEHSSQKALNTRDTYTKKRITQYYKIICVNAMAQIVTNLNIIFGVPCKLRQCFSITPVLESKSVKVTS